MSTASHVVLVLGAGINGCAIARELLLAGVSAWVVDRADIASGATAGSSRLIHGGLRYLEYGEFDLVKESLAERTRLLRLGPAVRASAAAVDSGGEPVRRRGVGGGPVFRLAVVALAAGQKRPGALARAPPVSRCTTTTLAIRCCRSTR